MTFEELTCGNLLGEGSIDHFECSGTAGYVDKVADFMAWADIWCDSGACNIAYCCKRTYASLPGRFFSFSSSSYFSFLFFLICFPSF